MLRKTTIYLLPYFIFIFTACSNKNTIQLVWEMGDHYTDILAYDNSLSIVNNGSKALDSNWVIYFNQAPAKVVSHDSTLHIEQISATYFKIYPSEHYQPILPKESLKFNYACRSSVIKLARAPEGAYVVMQDVQGNDKTPVSLTIQKTPYERASQWSRSNVDELPYPYGELMYEENQAFEQQALKPTDIFPSFKSIEAKDGIFQFTKDLQIEDLQDRFPEELSWFKSQLKGKFGCSIHDVGSTKITLIQIEDSEYSDDIDAYTLSFKDNEISIASAHAKGIFYGMQSLLQIIKNHNLPFELSNMEIYDYADFNHRGFMLDVTRNFSGKDEIFKLIELFSAYKLNVLHLHITDDEGWRLEIPGLEELTDIASRRGHTLTERDWLYPAYGGGWDPNDTESTANGYYTKQDFIDILQYAHQHHMKIIPEVDLPGHARAAIKAMEARYYKHIDSNPAKAKEYLLSDFNDESVYLSAQAFTDNTICVALPSVYTFVDKVITEIVKMYEEAGLQLNVFHIGGDEVPRGAWEGSKICLQLMEEEGIEHARDLKDYFVAKVLAIIADKNLQLAGWQELALLPDLTANPMFKDANLLSYCWSTIPSRASDQIPYKLANAGYPIILSNVTNLYFDQSYNKHEDEPGAYWAGFYDEINSFDILPFNIYKSVRKDLKGNPRDYVLDIATKEKLTAKGKNRIIGIQAQLWTETVRSTDMVEYYIFPKLYGLVERAWNASPIWEQDTEDSAYLHALNQYMTKISLNELPYLAAQKVNFRLRQPGVKIDNGILYANSIYPNAEIRYTTDGSEPNQQSALWTEPIACESTQVRAKVFYQGKTSVASKLRLAYE